CVTVRGSETTTALYGETLHIPCNKGASPPADMMFIKWKYVKDDGSSGDLLVRQARNDKATIQATDSYAQRISIDDHYSLHITNAALTDQRTFTCMVVSESNLREYSVTVSIKKAPKSVNILDKAAALEKDKLTEVATCVASDAHPAAVITWNKNGQPLQADGKVVVITPSMKVDPATGLSTTSSVLQVAATKADASAIFSCHSENEQDKQDLNLDPFPIHYPSEKVTLEVLPKRPIVEGDNVTLKCHGDGNPPPTSFNFHIKGQKMLVEKSDKYILTAVTRGATGEYKCSLPDNQKLEASQSIAVAYLDLSLSPSGKIVKNVGDTLPVKMEKNASGDAKVSWSKDGKAVKAPEFSKLTYTDAGHYICEVSLSGLTKRQSFELVVEGKPVITSLTKHRAEDAKYKVLTCEADAVPEPTFQWSVNSTDEGETSYVNGKAIHKIIVIPKANLTVSCFVTNKLGDDFKTINVSSIFNEPEGRRDPEGSSDQAGLIVGVVVGLLLAAAAVGLIYWLHMKNSRQGSWKTGEKEVGTTEESKKLEENNHTV
ncbi:hypothetical protein INR49_032422, partial [Caranx melampygus]